MRYGFKGANNKSYTVEKGMTWEEFINSSYSNGDFKLCGDTITIDSCNSLTAISLTDVIKADEYYSFTEMTICDFN